VTKISTSHSFF